jgi:tetratricopeptide (TPR) repeat protein/tRNA A-37 threonylcarbamoyl transferase component Bud32
MIGKTISHYRILEKLGEGGMGVVYKAEDSKLKRHVALKFLPTNLTADEEAKERFIQEAQSASALDHPNICTIYEINQTEEGQMFIAMAYYGGEILKNKIASRQLAVSTVIDITQQIGKGLAKAHQHGIFHRDIKPANVMVLSDGLVKILDFGLAKLIGSKSITKPGTVLGTTAYMSPEQLLGGEVDQRTDVWSLGVVMYEMLTGKQPFRGEYDQAIVYSIMHEAPDPLSQFRPEISPDLEQIIARAVIKDKEMRYGSVTELLQALENLQAPKGTSVRRAVPDVETWENTIVVHDFTNITANPADDWLAGGIAETVTVDFKRISALKVISREMVARAVAQLPLQKVTEEKMIDLGNMLKVRWIVWGAYQKMGNTIRITARCTEVATGSLAGTAKVDGVIDDIFNLQDQLITSLMDTLHLALSRSEIKKIQIPETIELKAYEYYAKGRQLFYQFNLASLQEAQQFYEKAIELDPNYALAYSGLGSAFIFRFIAQTNLQDLELGIANLNKALQIDPGLVEPYLWLSYAYQRKLKYDEAIQVGLRAIELDDMNYQGYYYLGGAYYGQAMNEYKSERYGDAIRYLKKSAELQPNYQPTPMILGYIYVLHGQYQDAQPYLDRAVEIEDSGRTTIAKFVGALTLRGNLELRQQQWHQASDYYQRSIMRLEGIQHVYRDNFLSLTYCGIGQLNFHLKNYDKAIEAYQQAIDVISKSPRTISAGYFIVRVHLGLAKTFHQLGMTREAKGEFEKALPLFSQKQQFNFSPNWEACDAQMYYDVASYHALVNHQQEALEYLQKAIDCGWSDLPTLESDDSFSLVRDKEDFKKMVQDLKTQKPV